MEEYTNTIENFADQGLRDGEITEQQYRYITNRQKPSTSIQKEEELHMANPKPQYKTHKVDAAGTF